MISIGDCPVSVGASARVRGFGLVELVVTLAVAGVLVAIALPSFREVGINSAVSGTTNELVTALNTARAEAVKRGAQVAVISVGDNWSTGWTVQADGDHDNAFGLPPADPVLATHAALSNGYTITALASGGGNSGRVIFGASGELRGVPQFDLNVCRPDHTADRSRHIVITGSGSASSSLSVAGSPAPGC